jgi:D-alanyl-D-alanine-carboxypeptidase/D-alanyl-D-alanine-endopeptidase
MISDGRLGRAVRYRYASIVSKPHTGREDGLSNQVEFSPLAKWHMLGCFVSSRSICLPMLKYSLLLFVLLWETGRAQVTPLPLMDTIVRNAATALTKDSWVGLSVGVFRDGQVFQYNFGNSGGGNIPTAGTLYEIGSITKTFTTLLLAQAVLEKKATLTDDIRQYLKGDYPNLQFKGKPIELGHLANLTSSLPNNMPDFTEEAKKASPDSFAYVVIKANAHYSKANFFDDLHHVRLDTFPGLNPRHSNAAAMLLGYILENIFGKPYDELVKQYVTGPVQMSHTYISLPTDQAGLLAKCYNERGISMPYIMPNAWAAGGMSSCLDDMTRYMVYQLSEKNEAVRLTHQVAWGNPDEFAVGLNWFLGETFDGKRKVSNDGTTFGFTTCFLLYPEQHFGVIILSNECGSGVTTRLYGMADKIFNRNFYTAAERASDGFGFSLSVNLLLKELNEKGFEHAVDAAGGLAKSHPEFILRDNEVNVLAYSLLRKGKKQEALEIFKLNTALHPDSWNDYDSEAEGYDNVGDTANAIKYYRRSLELNPNNTNAAEQLKKLGQP